jgi:hypothetical protein
MSKRRITFLSFLFVLTAMAGALPFWFRLHGERQIGVAMRGSRQPARPSRAAFAQIGMGMTRAEVEAIVGSPPGYYGPGELDVDVHRVARGLSTATWDHWICTEGELLIRFSDGRVADMLVYDAVFAPLADEYRRKRQP